MINASGQTQMVSGDGTELSWYVFAPLLGSPLSTFSLLDASLHRWRLAVTESVHLLQSILLGYGAASRRSPWSAVVPTSGPHTSPFSSWPPSTQPLPASITFMSKGMSIWYRGQLREHPRGTVCAENTNCHLHTEDQRTLTRMVVPVSH